MTDQANRIVSIFERLSSWRNLPDYQLERRADIFFTEYLPSFLAHKYEKNIDARMIPEFPVKLDNNQSVKVDYALFSKDRRDVYFVELKTDMGSRRPTQDELMRKTADQPFANYLEGLIPIFKATKARKKYYWLLHQLKQLGYLKIPDEIAVFLYEKGPRQQVGLTAEIDRIQLIPNEARVNSVFLQPSNTETPVGTTCIDFKEFSDFVARSKDPFSRSFAEALDEWHLSAAGDKRPE